MNLNRLHNDIHEGALQLMAEHRVQLFAKARSLCDSDDEADELVIRTIDQAIRKIDTYQGKGSILSWMALILENLHINDHRNFVTRGTVAVDAETLERYAGADWSTEEQILKNSDSEAIRKALAGLDPKYNQVLLMRYYGEFSLKQIARVLELPLGTVCRRMQIAHRLLAGKLCAEFGRMKKPLVIFAAVLSFAFVSAAALIATVPALAPVRETVAGWFAGGDDGGTGDGGTGDGGTGVPPVQVAEDGDGGTGAPPVQGEIVSEPKQEDATPTQAQAITIQEESEMKATNPKAKLSMCALATALLSTPLTAVSADNVFIKTGEPGRWGEAENWQNQLPPNEDSTAIKFGKNDGLPFAAYLKDGDHFAYPNATVTVGCNARTGSKCTSVGLTIPTNASLKASEVSIGTAGATGLVEVVGGSLTTSGKIALANDGAQIRQVDGTVTSSYLDFMGSIDVPRYELLGGELKLDTADTAHGVWMRARYSSSFCQRGGKLTSSYIRFEAINPATIHVGPERYDFYDGEICLSGKHLNWGRSGVTFNSAGLATFCQHGGSLTATDIYFCGAGDGCSRYELLGGTLTLTGGIYQKKAYPAVFSVRGSTPKMTLSGIDCSVDDFSLLIEFVIDRTGAPSVGFAYNGPSSTRFLGGAYAVKLDGGLQLLHTNVFGFVDSHVEGCSAAQVKAAPKRYADLNTAERHLWTFGPYSDANANPTGVLVNTMCFGAQLNPNEEFVPGKRYGGGRSCGWVRLPKFKSVPDACRVLLDVVPQGEHTIKEIVDGMKAAGYPTKCAPGSSVLRVMLPVENLSVGSTDEVVAFDFAEYDTAASVRTQTPTDVRALVRQVDVVQGPGMMVMVR